MKSVALLFTASYFLGFVMIARSLLFWLAFVQKKQYRLDRIRLELKNKSFWRLIFSAHRIIILLLLLVFPSVILFFSFAFLFVILADFFPVLWRMGRNVPYGTSFLFSLIIESAYLGLYASKTILGAFRRSLQLPARTKKIIALFSGLFIIELFFASALPKGIFIVEFLQPALVMGVIALLHPLNRVLQMRNMERAQKKLRAFPNLKVVGITGSYGKTSAKEFLAHILSKKYRVLKTPAHINVDTGVAQVILSELKPEHEVFIVEMGAYKRGEIKKICDLTHPQYAIMTGLSDQHLELFGSLENIAKAKFELVEAVVASTSPARNASANVAGRPTPSSGRRGIGTPPAGGGDRGGGSIVANAESEPLVQEFKQRGIEPVWFGRGVNPPPAASSPFTEGGGKRWGIIGSAANSNLSGAMVMAKMIGMGADEIAEAIKDIKPVAGTMEPKERVHGSLIIDDSYNANTEGVITALRDLPHLGRAQKILVFSEVIELGPRTKEDHARIAKTIAEHTDYVLLLPSRMREFLVAELEKIGYDPTHILAVRDVDKLKEMADQDSVILFEGRGGERLLHVILSDSDRSVGGVEGSPLGAAVGEIPRLRSE